MTLPCDALKRPARSLTTTEGAAFEWTGGAGHPQFKAVSLLVQERMKAILSAKE